MRYGMSSRRNSHWSFKARKGNPDKSQVSRKGGSKLAVKLGPQSYTPHPYTAFSTWAPAHRAIGWIYEAPSLQPRDELAGGLQMLAASPICFLQTDTEKMTFSLSGSQTDTLLWEVTITLDLFVSFLFWIFFRKQEKQRHWEMLLVMNDKRY